MHLDLDGLDPFLVIWFYLVFKIWTKMMNDEVLKVFTCTIPQQPSAFVFGEVIKILSK